MEDTHELERLVIGGLLKFEAKAYTEIEGKLKPEYFSNPQEHRNIFLEIILIPHNLVLDFLIN